MNRYRQKSPRPKRGLPYPATCGVLIVVAQRLFYPRLVGGTLRGGTLRGGTLPGGTLPGGRLPNPDSATASVLSVVESKNVTTGGVAAANFPVSRRNFRRSESISVDLFFFM